MLRRGLRRSARGLRAAADARGVPRGRRVDRHRPGSGQRHRPGEGVEGVKALKDGQSKALE